MTAKYKPMNYSAHKGGGGPPKRTIVELADELGVSFKALKLAIMHNSEGYPQGSVHGNGARTVYHVRKDFIKWWLSLPEEVRAKAKARKD